MGTRSFSNFLAHVWSIGTQWCASLDNLGSVSEKQIFFFALPIVEKLELFFENSAKKFQPKINPEEKVSPCGK